MLYRDSNDPVVKASDRLIKAKRSDDQITISSASRDRCTAQIEAAAKSSSAKSRSDTASIAFAAGRSKPSSSAVWLRSIGNDVPASAAAPNGDSLSRARASVRRPRSRPRSRSRPRPRPRSRSRSRSRSRELI